MSPPLAIRRLERGDLARIEPQPAQRWVACRIAGAEGAILAAGPAFVAVDADARPIAAGGVAASQGAPVIGWALLSAEAGRHMLQLTREARRFLDRLAGCEAGIDPTFPAACRWARALGFIPLELPVTRYRAGRPLELWLRGAA